MSKTPKPSFNKRLKYLFTGHAGESVAPPAEVQAERNPLEGLSRAQLAHKLLQAVSCGAAPDLPLIRDILLRDPDLLQSPVLLTVMSVGGRPPEIPWLCCAAGVDQNGSLIRFMIESGAPFDERDTLYKGTPLYWAAMKGNKVAAEILLEAGGGIEDRSNMLGKTPSETAAHFGHDELATWLKAQAPMVPRIPDLLRQPKGRVVFKP